MNKIYNHISLGRVILICELDTKGYCTTVADNIKYTINLIDLIDY